MWILPKNISDTFHFAVDTKELGLDSEEFSQTCEKSLMWRSKPSQSPTWLRRWKRIKYLQHLSGRILKPSHTKSFLDELTSSLGDSHVNLFPMQEAEKELKTQDTSTPTLAMESEDVDQDLFSWKTLKESSVPKQRQDEVFCSMSSKTWKAWVTSQRQEYSQRAKLAHHTRGKESLSWGTPRNCSAMSSTITPEIASNKKRFPNLETQVGQQNWATPQASDHIEGVRTGVESPQKCLGRDLKMLEEKQKNWPTPASRDYKGANSIEHITGKTASKRGHMGQLPNAVVAEQAKAKKWPTPTTAEAGKIGNNPNYGQLALSNHPAVHGQKVQRTKLHKDVKGKTKVKTGQQTQNKNNTTGKNQGQHLNPNWVEQLMGLPVGWTDLGSWEMESYPKQ